MSGSLGPINGGGGVDASIPLRAGGNPLESVNNFARTLGAINQTKLQGQALQSGTMSLWQQQKQLAYAHIAPLVAQGRINNIGDLTSALAGVEANGVVTAPFIKDMVDSLGVGGGNFVDNLKAQTVGGTQAPENAVKALAPAPGTLDSGGQIIPTLTPNAGMPGQGVPSPSAAGFVKGYTPGEQLPLIHRPATAADVARDPTLTIGQDIIAPATTIPAAGGYNPGIGGARVPMSGASPGGGGYSPPTRPLSQLGPAYTPPGGAAPPGGSGVAPPGTRLMTAPDGSKGWVPIAQVPAAIQHGYK